MLAAAPPWRLPEHSLRQALTDELHARPFTPVSAPSRLLHLAFMPERGAAERAPGRDEADLDALLAAIGGARRDPAAGLSYYLGEIRPEGLGRAFLKWERHTEFVSLVLTFDGPTDAPPFSPRLLEALPERWIEGLSGRVISATSLEIHAVGSDDEAERAMRDVHAAYFAPESLAVARVSGGTAIAMGDFRIDAAGFTRFAVLATPAIGPRRLGRIAQRLIELETYRTLSMLALPMARSLSPRLVEIERTLAEIAGAIATEGPADDAARQARERRTLSELTAIAAELERLASETAFRFGAARAYASIVDERIAALRETRLSERPLFEEFMTRRYRPAMRTVQSVGGRLVSLSERAQRAANLLRTRVDVTLAAQNQSLLESMDRRAQLQLRLQQTVEGLSVVAISYYAVSLAGAVLAPLADGLGTSEKLLKALVAIPIVVAVWLFVRRIRRGVEAGV